MIRVERSISAGRAAAMGRIMERSGRFGQALALYQEAMSKADTRRKRAYYTTQARRALAAEAERTMQP